MKTRQVVKILDITHSILYDYAAVEDCLNVYSKESHQRARDGRDT